MRNYFIIILLILNIYINSIGLVDIVVDVANVVYETSNLITHELL